MLVVVACSHESLCSFIGQAVFFMHNDHNAALIQTFKIFCQKGKCTKMQDFMAVDCPPHTDELFQTDSKCSIQSAHILVVPVIIIMGSCFQL